MPGAVSEFIDDIEDLISSQDITPKERYASRKNVNVRSKKRENKVSEPVEKVILESVVPEYMAGLLSAQGYPLTDDKWEAKLWLLNSCTGAPRAAYLQGLSVVGVQQIDRIVEIVEETLKGGASLLLPKVRKNPLIEIISINTGCLNQCTYCKTKHARGELGSYPPEEIVERARQFLHVPVQAGSDQVLADMKREYTRRDFEHVVDFLKEKCVSNTSCYVRFLHVPVQAGSDQVLADMKRGYTRRDFEHVVDFLKEKCVSNTSCYVRFLHVPVQAGSDQTEKDFEDTMALCDKYRFPSLFINQFFPRPGTPAANMTRVRLRRHHGTVRQVSLPFTLHQPVLPSPWYARCQHDQDTMALCDKYRFPSLFINQFFPRPGTPAANMTRVRLRRHHGTVRQKLFISSVKRDSKSEVLLFG
ncbi:CDKAL1-like protein [Operophtera brumata]|uniref:CDKAL1-like protein n=1 Tax=Operophtera brumata TaxID=104452 RepID=A0A0L7KWN9_OPEBR|nr:CDKAL1-like protein [Operophtera brumata]